MAGRAFVQQSYQLQRYTRRLYMHVTFGAAGAVTLDTPNSKGIAAVTKAGTGLYTITLGSIDGAGRKVLDTYNQVAAVNDLWDASGNSGTMPAAPLVNVNTNSVGTGSITLQCTNLSGTATNPASGEGLYLEIITHDAK